MSFIKNHLYLEGYFPNQIQERWIFKLVNLERAKLFIKILYHGYGPLSLTFIGEITNNGWKESTRKIIEPLNIQEGIDTYTSLGIYSGDSRSTENVLARTAFYVDIDCHDNPSDELLEAVQQRIFKLMENGEIRSPNIIGFTGRGYGILYVLDKPVYINSNTKQMVKKFEIVYKKLLDEYESKFKDIQGVDIDKSVMDASRVIRILGTFNTKAGKYTDIIYYDDNNYIKNFEDVLSNKIEKSTSSCTNPKKEKAQYDENSGCKLLQHRMECIVRLADYRAKVGDKMRHMMAFMYYNCAVQIMPINEAIEAVYELNNHFAVGLQSGEINSIIRSINRDTAYKFSNSTFKSKMGISNEEDKEIGLRGISKKIKVHEDTERQKKFKNKRIAVITLVKEHPEYTYQIIAKKAEVSLRYVNNVVKAEGIHRYKKNIYVEEAEKKKLEENQRKIMETEEQITNIFENLQKKDCTILSRNKVLADMFLMILAKKYSNMNNVIDKYNKLINEGGFKSKMLVNAIAWIADKTETDYYGWEYDACQNICSLSDPINDIHFVLKNGKRIKWESLFKYKCSKDYFKEEEIKDPYNDYKVSFNDESNLLDVPYEESYKYRRIAENQTLVDEYISELIARYDGYVNVWNLWEDLADDYNKEKIRRLYDKICKSTKSKITNFLDYAMSACATSNMEENIRRICKYFKVDDIDDIDKKVLPEFRIPSKKQRENYRLQAKLKAANDEKNKYMRKNTSVSIICQEIRKLRSLCFNMNEIKVNGIMYKSDVVKKVLYRLDINDVKQLEKDFEIMGYTDQNDIYQMVLDRAIEIAEKKYGGKHDWKYEIVNMLPAIA